MLRHLLHPAEEGRQWRFHLEAIIVLWFHLEDRTQLTTAYYYACGEIPCSFYGVRDRAIKNEIETKKVKLKLKK